MRRMIPGGLLGLALAPGLAGCGPDWQPSWDTASRPAVVGDSLTVRRVAGEDPPFEPVRSQNIEQLRLTVGALLASRPAEPEAAMTGAPPYSPMPRPGVDAATAPRAESEPPPPRRARGSSTPPPVASVPPRSEPPPRPVAAPDQRERERTDARTVIVPGQPPAVVTNDSGRVQSLVQPGNPAGGTAIRDGGTTTIIQPGGRVTTVPTPR